MGVVSRVNYRDILLGDYERSFARIRRESCGGSIWSRSRFQSQFNTWVEYEAARCGFDVLRYLGDNQGLLAILQAGRRKRSLQSIMTDVVVADLLEHSGCMLDRAYDLQFTEDGNWRPSGFVMSDYEPKAGFEV